MRRGKKGQILILVLGVMALGLFVVTPLLAFVDMSFRLNMRAQMKVDSYYAAEAGVERVIGDLYMGTNILAGNDSYSGIINTSKIIVNAQYIYRVNVSEPDVLGLAPLSEESYVDPGSCMGMRPIAAGGVWEYNLFLTEGEDMKVNWPAYVADDACDPIDDPLDHFWGAIVLLDEDGVPVLDHEGKQIRVEVGSGPPFTGPSGEEARTVTATLYIDGALPGPDGEMGTPDDEIIIESGHYIIRFKNKSFRGVGPPPAGTNVSVCAPPPQAWGDYDYIFSGNVSGNDCDDFIDNTWFPGSNVVVIGVFNEDSNDQGDDTNTDTFFCDYVQLNITTDDGNVSTYTYNGTTDLGVLAPTMSWSCETSTDPGGDMDLADSHGEGTDGTPYAPGSYGHNRNYYADLVGPVAMPGCFATRVRFSDEDYGNISHNEGLRFAVPAPVAEANAMMMHFIEIFEDPNDVVGINVTWEGYQHKAAIGTDPDSWDRPDNDHLYLLMWNRAPIGLGGAAWHVLDHREQNAGALWGKLFQGAYKDYLITSWAWELDKDGDPSKKRTQITVYLRQSPGPSIWWREQGMEILSWNVQYFE